MPLYGDSNEWQRHNTQLSTRELDAGILSTACGGLLVSWPGTQGRDDSAYENAKSYDREQRQ